VSCGVSRALPREPRLRVTALVARCPDEEHVTLRQVPAPRQGIHGGAGPRRTAEAGERVRGTYESGEASSVSELGNVAHARSPERGSRRESSLLPQVRGARHKCLGCVTAHTPFTFCRWLTCVSCRRDFAPAQSPFCVRSSAPFWVRSTKGRSAQRRRNRVCNAWTHRFLLWVFVRRPRIGVDPGLLERHMTHLRDFQRKITLWGDRRCRGGTYAPGLVLTP
jgi:hypothetical protein